MKGETLGNFLHVTGRLKLVFWLLKSHLRSIANLFVDWLRAIESGFPIYLGVCL